MDSSHSTPATPSPRISRARALRERFAQCRQSGSEWHERDREKLILKHGLGRTLTVTSGAGAGSDIPDDAQDEVSWQRPTTYFHPALPLATTSTVPASSGMQKVQDPLEVASTLGATDKSALNSAALALARRCKLALRSKSLDLLGINNTHSANANTQPHIGSSSPSRRTNKPSFLHRNSVRYQPMGSSFDEPQLSYQAPSESSHGLRNINNSTSNNANSLKCAERRRRFFLRKQTNSAPDSFDSSHHGSYECHGSGVGCISITRCLEAALRTSAMMNWESAEYTPPLPGHLPGHGPVTFVDLKIEMEGPQGPLGARGSWAPPSPHRKSWTPQHQSSLEVPPPRYVQSARNSLAAVACGANAIPTPGESHFLKALRSPTRNKKKVSVNQTRPSPSSSNSMELSWSDWAFVRQYSYSELSQDGSWAMPARDEDDSSGLSVSPEPHPHPLGQLHIRQGLVRGRDGGRDSTAPPYINLPSPNVQQEEDDVDGNSVFPNESSRAPMPQLVNENDGENEDSCPPASALTRRRALVPPRPPYSVHESNEEAEPEKEQSQTSNEEPCARPQRRSSIVVIPPMQICPGDLLVYSKVLTQRSNLLDLDGSTQSLAGEQEPVTRKHKNSWSLLKLFDRSGRSKSESLSGLEEVLTCLQPSEFIDDQLTRYRGYCWSDFLTMAIADPARPRLMVTSGQETDDGFSVGSHSVESNQTEITTYSIEDLEKQKVSPPPLAMITLQNGKDWRSERRARLGLVRAQSERSLDRNRAFGSRLQNRQLTHSDSVRIDDLHTCHEGSITDSPSCKEESDDSGGKHDIIRGPENARSELREREALWDLFQSKVAFLHDHLMVLKNVYMDPLKKVQVEGYVMCAEPELLFGNLDELCCVTYAFCKEFMTLLLQSMNITMPTAEILVKLFQKSAKARSLSQAYHRYALNYINALNYLETLRRHVEFCEFEKWCNRDPRCKKLQLTDLLVAPVQHIMKVPLLLKEIESRTENIEDREAVSHILEREEASLRELDDKMKWLKNFERLLEIQRNLVWPSVMDMEPKMFVPDFLKIPLTRQPCERLIVSPRRQIVLEGPLSLMDAGKPADMHLILFDDMLLITRKKKGLGKKQKSSLSDNWGGACNKSCVGMESGIRYVVHRQPLSLDRFFLHDVTGSEAATCRLEAAFVLISLNRFQQIVTVYTFQAQTDQTKQMWLNKIRETQERWKRTLQTTVFRAQRQTPLPQQQVPKTSNASVNVTSPKTEAHG